MSGGWSRERIALVEEGLAFGGRMPSDTRAASALSSSSRGTGTKPAPGSAEREEVGDVGGMGRLGTGGAWPMGRRGIEGRPGASACEAATEVAAVKLLRRDVLRVRMPSLGGGVGLRLGRPNGDGHEDIRNGEVRKFERAELVELAPSAIAFITKADGIEANLGDHSEVVLPGQATTV
ncbi:hypothetical protein CHGG_08961 [Chaetomium globosum CBS 148.51]|uniref:Uncharacterized protein n=1 Tax=Chaetomium globosum (strain ATCC 6205 / CBS 148.51 / DSM 1962 / NBRC 6347 / NRRL 1970) TaxID=306901 RepID=Q2GSU3_CHAGB|nr:uncharacterized protein CHGG_08961 [Chaetomium globosum CBS 148.51]EAQ84947.1 hypothetical protein CHGG_08961 [Chaetomium globosum CBS 148.51]